ncbi:hypothetical protein MASR1M66_02160 [Aminivibrio sp.]
MSPRLRGGVGHFLLRIEFKAMGKDPDILMAHPRVPLRLGHTRHGVEDHFIGIKDHFLLLGEGPPGKNKNEKKKKYQSSDSGSWPS